ncbi:endonuclease-reverse transcriptase [Elysia marginata]|uniref:Endonuclease-reverse transcriptase n=1 Tax=Elysia marginata TaxID=1093978 RepID=A0AAV4K547_9GAST|nr:endonuclease-reverse transcriptase [Elysia marginata]
MKSYNPVSDRILTVKLNTKPAALNIIQVYAPTSASTQEEAEQFYSGLQAIKDKMHKREVCIIMGDFNANVGEGLEHESGSGPFGLGERNERGEMSACFCQANGMTITNTCFKQHPKRRYTWIQPGDRARNQIDYILITNEWKTTVLNSKPRPCADCETDHILVAAKISLKANKIVQPKQSARFDTDKLKDLKIRNQFQIEIKNRFEPLLQDWSTKEKTPNELWEEIKKCFTEVAEKNLGKRRKKPAKPYISEEVIELAKQKSRARKNGNKEKYMMLKKEIQMKLKRDKKSWLEQECAKMHEWNEKRKSKELFDQVKSIQSKKFSSKNICINDVNALTKS